MRDIANAWAASNSASRSAEASPCFSKWAVVQRRTSSTAHMALVGETDGVGSTSRLCRRDRPLARIHTPGLGVNCALTSHEPPQGGNTMSPDETTPPPYLRSCRLADRDWRPGHNHALLPPDHQQGFRGGRGHFQHGAAHWGSGPGHEGDAPGD